MSQRMSIDERILQIEQKLQHRLPKEALLQIQRLSEEDQLKVITLTRRLREVFFLLTEHQQRTVLLAAPPRIQRKILRTLTNEEVVTLLIGLDDTDVKQILSSIHDDRAQHILLSLHELKQKEVALSLEIEPHSVEALMSSNMIVVTETSTIKEVAQKIDIYMKTEAQAPILLVVNHLGRLVGRVFFAILITTDSKKQIGSIVQKVHTVSRSTEQEEVAHMLRSKEQDDLVVVIDDLQRPLGVVHARDLLGIMERESTEHLYGFAGVYGEERAIEPFTRTVRYRSTWLVLNLGTALLAASVVGLFQGTLEQLVILAAYMPVVAGMGGNAGTQTLAVVVRGLSLGEIPVGSGRKVLFKEVMAGLINGCLVGFIVSLFVLLWNQNLALAFVLGVSMVIALLTASFFGTLIPLVLVKMKIDPAISSSIFLTTLTDVIGFLAFLGLATLIML